MPATPIPPLNSVVGAAAFSLHARHHRRVFDAFSPAAIDRAATLVR